MNTTTTLTQLERIALDRVINSEYHDGKDPVNHPVWSHGLFDKQLTGAVSSCSTKGYVVVHGAGKDATIQITELGMAAYIAGY